ncbi:hypothetical protein DUI87_22900 [Hirundo rustica rustica]|uniref:Uncharacterized protein n=1 Tax=Hirundo rustica rustica TaxID=333673 RepID=A0A3M0JHC2_HIRRU|nr:hypothetical protein DUI87_22900 [Hirundo rustica rustica]
MSICLAHPAWYRSRVSGHSKGRNEDIRKMFFTEGVIGRWNGMPRDVGEALYLEVFRFSQGACEEATQVLCRKGLMWISKQENWKNPRRSVSGADCCEPQCKDSQTANLSQKEDCAQNLVSKYVEEEVLNFICQSGNREEKGKQESGMRFERVSAGALNWGVAFLNHDKHIGEIQTKEEEKESRS